MPAHLLLVRRGDEVLARGTAWFLRSDRVVTALHTVSAPGSARWRSDEDPDVTYTLQLPQGPVQLEPMLSDRRADLALLRTVDAPPRVAQLMLADEPPRAQDAWTASACSGDAILELAGQVVTSGGVEFAAALELSLDEGSPGASAAGAPVLVNGAVVGVLTRVRPQHRSAWAASSVAIARLLQVADAPDPAPHALELLRALVPGPSLRALTQDLGIALPSDSADLHADALAASLRQGEEGLLRLLDELERDLPDHSQLEVLRERLRRGQGEHTRWWASRLGRVREVVQHIERPHTPGVALLAPLGFGARDLVRETLDRLREPDPTPDLVVRLVPDRRTVDTQRLYGALMRDLRRGLENDLGRPLPPEWAHWVPERFDDLDEDDFQDVLTNLLTRVLPQSGRRLVLAVDGLGRVPERQRESWGWTMGRLTGLDGWKLLVWGGVELHELCSGLGDGELFSVFHHLEQVEVGGLQAPEVLEQLRERLGESPRLAAAADRVHSVTGGHPALVNGLLRQRPDLLLEATAPQLQDRTLGLAHLTRLQQALQGDAEAREVLTEVMRTGGLAKRRYREAERRLKWLGVLREEAGQGWRWTAPALQPWAALWLG